MAVTGLASAVLCGPTPTFVLGNAYAAAACKTTMGGQLNSTPWPQTRLDFQRAWQLTEGRGVTVAVADTGLFTPGSLAGMNVDRRNGYNVLSKNGDTRDCNGTDQTDDGHGTAVSAVIGAPVATDTPFVGVAPQATILPIKVTNGGQNENGSDDAALAIEYAIKKKAQVVNLSLTITSPTAELERAVADAQRHNVVLVAAGGNTNTSGGGDLKSYPAAYATKYDNVIAVSAAGQDDTVTGFSTTGNYMTVAAPGANIPLPTNGVGYRTQAGTSFAAPYVTGTVALMLSAHPGLTPAQVRGRLEATADPPPAATPDSNYGYGIVNPYLAVTATGDYAVVRDRPSGGPPIKAPAAVATADHSLQHTALGVGLGLLGLAVLFAVGAAVWRADRRARRSTITAAG